MSSTKLFTELCADLAGMPVSHVWRGHGSTVFLEIGKLTSTLPRNGSAGNPKGEIRLHVDCSWRIEERSSIVCGSWSDEGRWQPAFDRLQGGRILGGELFGALPEVVITTDSGMRFVSFSTTEGQPEWAFIDSRVSPNRCFCVQDGQPHYSEANG